MTWQEKVKELMKNQGINQKKLSQLSGITEASISRYLKGERTARLDIIINFAKALNVTTDYLLNDDEETELKPYQEIATAIARNGNSLTAEEKNQLIALILGNGA
ncbi:MAG: helix-turn-helix transcriptional regulator [Clostridia bacterium]|nr:helix-turn-helix transcriptional regulator [Clostridia bacterium]